MTDSQKPCNHEFHSSGCIYCGLMSWQVFGTKVADNQKAVDMDQNVVDKPREIPSGTYSESMPIEKARDIILDNLWCYTLDIWKLRSAEATLLKEYDLLLKDNRILETQYNAQIIVTGELVKRVRELESALEKIADPRKRDHREPDAYTELGCVMHIANEALKKAEDT